MHTAAPLAEETHGSALPITALLNQASAHHPPDQREMEGSEFVLLRKPDALAEVSGWVGDGAVRAAYDVEEQQRQKQQQQPARESQECCTQTSRRGSRDEDA
eukprot:1986911-Rhodomonas_salina.1